jgi:hypothetical protein
MTLTTPESTSILVDRAMMVAETMLQRRLFKKESHEIQELTSEEKEIFISEVSKNKHVVSKLAQALIPKLRSLQEKSICWKGYKRKPNTKPYEAGSCIKDEKPFNKKVKIK